MKQGITFGVLAGACWGFIFLPPVLLPEISPLLLTCGRFATYGILAAILLIPQWRNIARVWHHRDLLTLIRLSLMSNVFYFLLVGDGSGAWSQGPACSALQAIIAADDGYHCWCGAD